MFVPGEATVTYVAKVLTLLLVVLMLGMFAETVLPHEPFRAEAAKEFLVLILALQL